MKIQIASDLHLEHVERAFPGFDVVEPAPEADVLVLAGDIHHAEQAVRRFADWPVPCVYVPGNHEYFGEDAAALRARLRTLAGGTRVTLLDDGTAVIGGVRFLGATLWTDYRLLPELDPLDAMDAADDELMDRRMIRLGAGAFAARDALQVHRASRRWLAGQLALPHDGPTVVVTHHGCSAQSTAPRFAGNRLNGAFMSDLSELMGPAALWVHGHVHDSFDYRLNGTRVVVNPRGYPRNLRAAATPAEIVWENPRFDPRLVVEV